MRFDPEKGDTNNSRRTEDVYDSSDSFEELRGDYCEDLITADNERQASRINFLPDSARNFMVGQSISQSEGRYFVPVFCKLRMPFDVYRFEGKSMITRRRDVVSAWGRYRKSKVNLLFVAVIEEDKICIDPIRLQELTSRFVSRPIVCERHVNDIWFFSWYVPNRDLGKYLVKDRNRHVFGEAHAQFVTAGLLLAVEHLHDLQIVHGNIQPSLILISSTGIPVLSGMERAFWVGDGRVTTIRAPNMRYSSPERVMYDIVDTSLDIFSIGCVAYEITAGKPPFQGYTSEETLDNIIDEDVKPLYNIDQFSYAGETFIDQCLSKDPEERLELDRNMSVLYHEEWFSSLDMEALNGNGVYYYSPLLEAMQQLGHRFDWERKRTIYNWGQVMDTVCPDHPSMGAEEGEVDAAAVAYIAALF